MSADLSVPVPAAADWFVGMIDQALIQAYVSDYLEALRQAGDDTGWTPFSIIASWTQVTGNPLQYRKIGSLVTIQGAIQRTLTDLGPGSAWTVTFATLPVGFRPDAAASPVTFSAAGSSVGSVMQVRIGSDGTLEARNMGTAALTNGTNMDINFHFLIG